MLRTLYLFLVSVLAFLVLNLCVSTYGQSSCQKNRLNAVKSGQQRVRGTNLGSWFVQESWMTPHLWDDNGCNKQNAPGSYLLEKCLGNKAQSVLEKHWSSFINESDFAELSRHGVNTVRIPVGWWQVNSLSIKIIEILKKITPIDLRSSGWS
jgi:aryl-phospho-beta-D-glucosidase BglC (GH1 family)